MRITSQEEFGLRCLLQIARKPPGMPMTATEIAEKENISVPYANKILHILKNKNLIESVRGMRGGFRLIGNKRALTIGKVIQALDENLFPSEFCSWYAGQGTHCIHHKESCAMRPLWSLISAHLAKIMSGISLADLVDKKENAWERVKQEIARN